MDITVLENRRIKVEPIIRKRAFFPSGHDGEHTYTGCHKDYGLPFDLKRRTYLNPFLNEVEQAQFEHLLDLPANNLNLYKRDNKFWGDFSLPLTKDGTTLDLSNAVDALWYRVLLVNPRFANNDDQKSNPKCEFVLVDEQVKKEEKSNLARQKDEALEEYMKIKKSRKKLYDTLRLLNKKPDPDAEIDSLKNKLLEVIDEPASARGVTNIADFMRIVKDPQSDLKLFVLDAVEAEEIIFSKDGYKVKDSGQFLGKHLEQVINYFSMKDADVLQTKAIIEQRLKDK